MGRLLRSWNRQRFSIVVYIRGLLRGQNRQPLSRRLNIGCGYDKREGYLNIDMDPSCQPDLLIVNNDLSSLPKNYFEEILAHDVLEHIPRAHTMSALLDWAALLKMGGTLTFQTSDIIGITTMMQQNPTFEFEFNWTSLMFGNQAHPGDFHYNGFTERTLYVHLKAAGFNVAGFSRKDGWLLSASVHKESDWTSLLHDLNNATDDDFLKEAYLRILGREMSSTEIQYFGRRSLKRAALLKRLAGSAENLYKIGAKV